MKINLFQRVAWGCALAALFAAFSLIKVHHLSSLPQFDSRDETGLFWTENAFHYRYARMVAQGEGLPARDRRVQYPEGLQVFREETPAMELFVGHVWRLFGDPARPFHVFLLKLVCWYSCAVLFPAYLLSASFWRRRAAGLVTVLFYGTTYAVLGVGTFLRQDFALPFLFMGVYGLFAGTATRSAGLRILGAAAMAIALASWHMTQFFFLVFCASLMLQYFLQEEWRVEIIRTLWILLGAAVAVSCCVPALRGGLFLVSPSMLLLYALVIQHAVLGAGQVRALRRGLVMAGVVIGMGLAVTWLAPRHYLQYSHVYGLVFDKIRFLGIKPLDPAKLGFESRVMWASSFWSPTWRYAAGTLGTAWVAAGIAAWFLWRSRRGRPRDGMLVPLVFLIVASILLLALMTRMDVLAAFFVSIIAGGVMTGRLRGWGGVARVLLLAVLLACQFARMATTSIGAITPYLHDVRPLYEAIREHAGPDEVILAAFPLGGPLAAYTGRPVVLHSKFENRVVREKVRGFLDALFSSESVFCDYCRHHDVSYFVLEPDMWLDASRESCRYCADRLDAAPDCAAAVMHNDPQKLSFFELVFQTDSYRVFRFVPGGVPR